MVAQDTISDELNIRNIYDALPWELIAIIPGSNLSKSDYHKAHTYRNYSGERDVFEIDASFDISGRFGRTCFLVEDKTTEQHEDLGIKYFSVSGKYASKNIQGVVDNFLKMAQSFGLRTEVNMEVDDEYGELLFEASCLLDEITPPKRAVRPLQNAIFDVYKVWRALTLEDTEFVSKGSWYFQETHAKGKASI